MKVLECFIKLMEADAPVIEVVTTAGSKQPLESFKEYKSAFMELGTGKVNHIHHATREDVQFDSLEVRLRTAHGIFIAGGDQLKLTSIYGGTAMVLCLKERYIYENKHQFRSNGFIHSNDLPWCWS